MPDSRPVVGSLIALALMGPAASGIGPPATPAQVAPSTSRPPEKPALGKYRQAG